MINKFSYLQKETERLKKIKGNVKGEVFKNHFNYILHKEGQEGVERLKEAMKELNWPIDISKIDSYKMYPEAHSVLMILTAKDIFNWSEEDVFNMGYSAPQSSFFIKIIIHYFVSIDKIVEEGPKAWKKHYDFGELKIVELDEKKKYCLARLIGYDFHPLLCIYFKGYFLRILEYVTNSKKIVLKETKCIYKGDPYHEFCAWW